MKGWNSPVKKDKKTYNPNEAYFQSLIKVTSKTPELSDEDAKDPEKRKIRNQNIQQKARQNQIIDYRNNQLKIQ